MTGAAAPSMTRPRRSRGWWVVALGLPTIVLLAVILAAGFGTAPGYQGGRAVGRQVPTFDLPTVDRQRVSSRDLLGSVYLVNFWNTWCIPCRQEHPALMSFYRRHASDPQFRMIGIVRDDTRSAVERYVRDQRLGWTIALDPGGQAALGFATFGQPETYAISRSGLVAAGKIGPSTVADLEALLRRARRAS